MASLSSSANAPRPEPRTNPICGRSFVSDNTKAAADSARVNKSGDVSSGFKLLFPLFLKAFLECREGLLQLPLHACALTMIEYCLARVAGFAGISSGQLTWSYIRMGDRVIPQGRTWNEAVLDACPGNALQIGIFQPVGFDRPQIF